MELFLKSLWPYHRCFLFVFGALAPCLASCVYDEDKPCGTGEMIAGGVCVCEPDKVESPNGGCVACGAHQQVLEGACACVPGYLPTQTGECVESTQGKSCTPGGTECDAGPIFTHCHDIGGGQGYCTTSSCTADADCAGAYACNTRVSPSFCRRPPSGLSVACQGPADCATFEATYCEVNQLHTCLVENCDMNDSLSCPRDQTCCQWSFGPPTTQCYPDASVQNLESFGASCAQ